jgi:hypothetical protein
MLLWRKGAKPEYPSKSKAVSGNRGALEGKMFSLVFLTFKGLIQPRAVITI